MHYRIPFLLGAGIGLAVGARIGAPAYDRLSRRVRALRERPDLQEVAGVVTAQAGSLAGRARGAMVHRISHGSPDGMAHVLSGPNGSSGH